MEWNQERFFRRIEHIIATECGGKNKEFNTKVGKRDAATVWRKRQPSLKNLLKITQLFGGSLDSLVAEIPPPKEHSPPVELVELKKQYDELHKKYTEALEKLLKYEAEREPYKPGKERRVAG